MKNFRITESAASKLPEESIIRFNKEHLKTKLYNQLNELLKNKIPIRYLIDKPTSVKYVMKKQSAIIRLFEKYGSEFPEETLETWVERWQSDAKILKPVRIDKFEIGNNKHLLLTILHEADRFIKMPKIELYIKVKWGLKSYHSDVSRYVINGVSEHKETKIIRDILKPD
jgi:ribosomal protein L11 methylase PrmA